MTDTAFSTSEATAASLAKRRGKRLSLFVVLAISWLVACRSWSA